MFRYRLPLGLISLRRSRLFRLFLLLSAPFSSVLLLTYIGLGSKRLLAEVSTPSLILSYPPYLKLNGIRLYLLLGYLYPLVLFIIGLLITSFIPFTYIFPSMRSNRVALFQKKKRVLYPALGSVVIRYIIGGYRYRDLP